MSVVVTDGGGGGDPAPAPALAQDVGRLEATTEHHAEALAGHAGRLENIESDTGWIRTRLGELETRIAEAPAAAIAELREQMGHLRDELTAQMAALSESIVTEEDPQTDPPPPQPNDADDPKPGPIGGLRKALHRLL